jgi:hypothetical protein
MKTFLAISITLVGACLTIFPTPSHADWSVIGVAYSCSKSGAQFELAPVVEASSSEDEVKAAPGFDRLKDGEHKLRCRVGKNIVKTSLRVYAPSDGQCMGSGFISIDQMTIGSFKFIDDPTNFNWSCQEDQELVRVRVYAKGSKTFVETCYSRSENGAAVVDCVSDEVK